MRYIKSKSLDNNIISWKGQYKRLHNVIQSPEKYIFGPINNFDGVMNEVVFKDAVSFDGLVGIYSYNAKWKHPLLMTTQKELREFLNEYGINDIDSDPQKHYYIPFSINWTEEKHDKVRDNWLKWAAKQTYISDELKKWKRVFNSKKTRKNINKK